MNYFNENTSTSNKKQKTHLSYWNSFILKLLNYLTYNLVTPIASSLSVRTLIFADSNLF